MLVMGGPPLEIMPVNDAGGFPLKELKRILVHCAFRDRQQRKVFISN
jgi:hypothetical protein